MTVESPATNSLAARWNRLWFRGVPPHVFALLRILFGALGLVSLFGLTPIATLWSLDGLVPVSANSLRGLVAAAGLATVAGPLAFAAMAAAFTAMTAGWRSNAAVLVAFLGTAAQPRWNPLPLSSAHQVLTVVLFCLVWADSGRVWSLDAWRGERAGAADDRLQPIWPLQLLRCQVALIYGASGLWKLLGPSWRDGSAVYYAMNLNVFHRFPWPIPPGAVWLLTVATIATLIFELAFPLLVLFRRTRLPALAAGVLLHLGLWLALELGPFSWIMIATYVGFLDPERVAAWIARRAVADRTSRVGRVGAT